MKSSICECKYWRTLFQRRSFTPKVEHKLYVVGMTKIQNTNLINQNTTTQNYKVFTVGNGQFTQVKLVKLKYLKFDYLAMANLPKLPICYPLYISPRLRLPNNVQLCPLQRIGPTDQKIPWKFQSRDQKLLLNKEGGGGNPQDGTQPSNLWQ